MLRSHPVLRHFETLLCILGIGTTVVISALVNPHSAAWLMSFYATLIIFIVARHKLDASPLLKSYCHYLFWMNQYMLLIWFLHVWVPGVSRQNTAAQVFLCSKLFGFGSIFLPVAWFHFTLRFARTNSQIFVWIERLGWTLACVLAVTKFTGDFAREYVWSGYTWAPKVGPWYSVYFLYTTFLVMLNCAIPIVQAARTSSHQHRLQLFYYSLGAVPLLLSCWMNFLLSMGYHLYPAGGIFFFVHVIVLAYAVLVHRVFDITYAVRRGLAYALVSILLAGLYPTLLWLGSRYAIGSPSNGAIAIFIFALATGLLYAPLHAAMQTFVDRVFFRQVLDRQHLLQDFIQQTALRGDLESLAESICKVSQAVFQASKISLYVNDASARPVLFGSYVDSFNRGAWPNGERLPAEIATQGSEHAVRAICVENTAQRQPLSFSSGAESLVVPIDHKAEKLGYLVLGPKRADEPYDDGDLAFVASVATHYSIALSNARTLAQLEHWQKTMVRMTEGMPAGIIMIERAGRVLQINSAAAKLLQADSQRQSVDHIAQLNSDFSSFILATIANQRLFRNREVIIRHDPKIVALVTIESLGAFDLKELYLICVNDITDYKALEQESIKKESLAQVGSYVSSINHELLNMLQPLQHQIQRIDRTNAADPEAITAIKGQAEALQRTLKSLQDVARPIELRIRKLNIRSMIDSVFRDMKDQPVSVGTQLTSDIAENSTHCNGDAHWLRQVLYNLVKNGAEACFGCTNASVSVSVASTDTQLSISVRDNGPGMDASIKSSLFRPFFSTKSLNGTGLGLCISKKVVELHGGRIDVQSFLGQGTVFCIVLPVRQNEVDALSSSAESISADV